MSTKSETAPTSTESEAAANRGISYKLSPLQQGMLLHTLRDTGVGMYINQATYEMEDLDPDALRQAWQQVIDRHSILRSSFHWHDLEEPMQLVHESVELPFTCEDWREFPREEQEDKLRKVIRREMEQGFDLTKPPLLQVSTFRIGDNRWYVYSSHHHIILDGWSGGIVSQEVRRFYEAALSGHPVRLPSPFQYRDYIEWLDRQDSAEAEQFWRSYLAGVRTTTPLPGDQGVDAQVGVRAYFGSKEIHFDPLQTRRLKALARRCHVTFNTLIEAAWSILLSRYSGEPDALFGIIVSGRPPTLEGVDSIVGMFLNSLPVRITVDWNRPLHEWLHAIKARQVELQQFEHSSLAQVQAWSEIPRGQSLFDSVIVRRDLSRPQGDHPQQQAEQTSRTGKAKKSTFHQNLPMMLEIVAGRAAEISLIYDARRFDAQQMTRLMQQMHTLLVAMPENPQITVGELPILSERERQMVLNEWNHTATPYPRDRCLHHLFEQQLPSAADKTAVRYMDTALSYDELNRQANALAHHLIGLGARPGSLIGLCVERSLDMPVALLAILKSGAAYVPLDPGFPLDRLAFMLEDAQVDLVVTQERMLEKLPSRNVRFVCLERDTWRDEPTTNPGIELTQEDLAYVLYTSGSTGKPKGVAIPHRVSVNRLHVEHDPFLADEALCAKTTLGFVDSIWELFSAWLNQLTVTLVPESEVKDPRLLVGQLAKANATRIVLVPSLLRALFESDIDLAARLPRLRHWISSGEPLPADLCREFHQRLPNAILTNLYGTTEVWDVTRCDSRERRNGAPIPIGRPLGNGRVYVLDEQMQPCPIGVAGELFIGGESLARGYWNQPDLTAEKFVPDPFDGSGTGRLYRSGDRARWLADGNLEHLGRLDQQFKLRGFRIEPGEIENVLRRHAAVRQAAVVVRGEDQLVAYIVPENDAFEPTELGDFAASHLPEHMSPTFYVLLERLPLTPSGKIDRRALPAPEAQQAGMSAASILARAPESELEKTIAQIWEETLNVRGLGAHDNFFDLGGHSLSAVRVTARLTKSLGQDVPLRGMFEAPTVASLAEWIETGKDHLLVPELVRDADRGKDAPMTYSQQRLWFVDQLNPGIGSYTLPSTMRLHGELDLDAVKGAYRDLVERHELLRTTFAAVDGEPRQIIQPTPDEIPVEYVDLRHVPQAERENMATSYARQQGREVWNLEHGPLFRVQVVTLSDSEHALNTAIHHIIADGRSMGIIVSEFSAFYDARVKGVPSRLEPLPLQYADFAIWERSVVQGPLFQQRLEYWGKVLEGAEPMEIPTDYPRPAVHSFQGAKHYFQIPENLAIRLRDLGREEQATSFMCVLACVELLLSRYSGNTDVTLGSAMSVRTRVELEPLIGLFVNTIPIRMDFSGNPSFREVLRRSRLVCTGAFANMDLPLEEMIRKIQPNRDLSRQGSPLFQMMYVHNPGKKKSEADKKPASGVSVGTTQHDIGYSNFDLVFSSSDVPDGEIDLTCLYDTELFRPQTINRLANHLVLLVEQVVAQPDVPLSNVSFLSEDERRELLHDQVGAVVEPLEQRCLHQVIEELARERPDAPAVEFEDRVITYGELDRQANRLAHELQQAGVGPERIVSVCFQSEPEMIIAIFGVLKAGGAFVPLDPEYPAERLRFILQDTSSCAVVTRSDLAGLFATEECPTICLDSREWQEEDLPEEPPPSEVTNSNLAYLIYTSGSTGTPKGVCIEHRNAANIVRSQLHQFELRGDDRVLLALSLIFGAAIGETFRALTAGATLCLARKDALLPGPGLVEVLQRRRITAVGMVPSALAALPPVENELPDLRLITMGGESCPQQLAARWRKRRQLINGYGPTEVTSSAVRALEWDNQQKPPLGKPLENVRLYVLDDHRNLVPVGTPGEIYIGGVGVSRGYLNQPELTSEGFIPDPFSDRPGERLYRTGDLGRWLADGNLEFLGRIDQQVKIRGFRIELGEIESVLSEHANVTRCVVDVHEEKGIKRLVGYITVPHGKDEPEPSALRDFLKQRLPEYMVPTLYMVLPELPLTSTGKIDRKSLPKPELSELTVKVEYAAPETPTQKTLAEIWTKLLGVEKVGLNDNFFELGGDSITSTQVATRAGERGIEITPKDIFQFQTLRELAEEVDGKPPTDPDRSSKTVP